MIGATVKQMQGGFLDKPAVIRRMDAATRRALGKFGANVRQNIIVSMLGHKVRSFGTKSRVSNREGNSAPGSPPLPHTGLLVRNIFFAAEGTSNVVIGPALLNAKGGAMALKALEYGGPSIISDRGKRKTVNVRARPSAQPAFDKEIGSAAHLWLNSLR